MLGKILMEKQNNQPALSPMTVIFIGVVIMSTASIIIRYAQAEAGSLAIASYRLVLAALILAPIVLIHYSGRIKTVFPSGHRLAAGIRAIPGGPFCCLDHIVGVYQHSQFYRAGLHHPDLGGVALSLADQRTGRTLDTGWSGHCHPGHLHHRHERRLQFHSRSGVPPVG